MAGGALERKTLTKRVGLRWTMALGLCFAGVVSGCSSDARTGYSFQSTYPTGIQTISVPIFSNSTMNIGVETEITEAVIKELQRSSPFKVTRETDAQTVLVGVVRQVEMRRLSLDSTTGLTQELAVSMTIDFDWSDRRTGKVLTSRRSFTSTDTFVPAQPTGERIDVGENAAINRLAKDVVHEMRSSW